MKKDEIYRIYKLMKNQIYQPLTSHQKKLLEYRYNFDVGALFSYNEGYWYVDKLKLSKWLVKQEIQDDKQRN